VIQDSGQLVNIRRTVTLWWDKAFFFCCDQKSF